jgi:hypothetical protein
MAMAELQKEEIALGHYREGERRNGEGEQVF